MNLAMKAAQPDITHAIFKIQEIAIPPIKEQQIIVQKLDALAIQTKKLESIYQKKIQDLEELKKSLLEKAFSGELKDKSLAIAV
jgi:type I restriction enzyme S subunit